MRRGGGNPNGNEVIEFQSFPSSEEEDVAMKKCLAEIPWSSDFPPRKPTMTNGPPLPNFYNSEYEAKVLSIDDESYICIQLCSSENHEERERLQRSMRSLYRKRKMVVPYESISVGDHMMTIDPSGLFRRVKVVQITSKEEIDCYDVDNAVFFSIGEDFIFIMSPEVLQYPIQVIKCQFYDLEILTGTDILSRIFGSLPEQKKPFTCQILINKEIPAIRLGIPGRLDLTVTDLIRQKLPIFCSLPTQIPDLSPISITNVDENGYIWFQYHAPLLENIMRFTESFDPQNYFLSPETLQEEVKERLKDKETVFLAFCNDDFYRAKVIAELQDDEVTVDYIDFGKVRNIGLKSLYTVDLVERNLNWIPAQCVKAHLSGIERLRDFKSFWSKVGHQYEILVRVVETGKVSEIELILDNKDCLNSILLDAGVASAFKKKTPPTPTLPPTKENCILFNEVEIDDNAEVELRAVNDLMEGCLDYESAAPENSTMEENGVGENAVMDDAEVLPGALIALSSLEYPKPRTQTKLRITNICSFDEFAVQEIGKIEKLEELEREMTIYYESLKNTLTPITLLELIEDGLYAFFTEERWIRVRVIGITPGVLQWLGRIVLRRVDYGFWKVELFFNEADWRNLQPLLPSFIKFPQQGFTATRYVDRTLPIIGTLIESELFKKGLVFNFWIKEREEVSESRDIPHLVVVYLDSCADNEQM